VDASFTVPPDLPSAQDARAIAANRQLSEDDKEGPFRVGVRVYGKIRPGAASYIWELLRFLERAGQNGCGHWDSRS